MLDIFKTFARNFLKHLPMPHIRYVIYQNALWRKFYFFDKTFNPYADRFPEERVTF